MFLFYRFFFFYLLIKLNCFDSWSLISNTDIKRICLDLDIRRSCWDRKGKYLDCR